MNIIVCIKQVPETTDVRINPETNTLVREGVQSIVNPFDMYAIEEGVRIKERTGGKLTVITMGPPQAEAALRQQTEELQARIDELNRFTRLAVGRELRMIELKRELNELYGRLGEPARYVIVADNAEGDEAKGF